ncbi:nucleotidyltransferase domain-containing protein [Jatrophihabitans sp.]|jgi:predicted nucleotidyltransferase|uniref:nucleotidyltransferase domain-containing protein n=1 Tax=Jatrophihabitans sp. TaxID=1932789 RepID=UPI002EE7DCFF
MNFSRPIQVVTPTADGDVLYILARAEAAFTPGQVRALAGRYTTQGVRNALNRLAEQGIVHAERTPTSVLYSLNRKHLAAPHVVALAELRTALIGRLRELISTWKTPPVYAALFGSAARSDMRTNSDLDLFLVRPADVVDDDATWAEQLSDLSTAATAWTGNDTRILDYAETRTPVRTGVPDPLLTEVSTHGLTLYGPLGWLRMQLREGK